MRQLLRALRSQIRYTIILPYLLLMVLITLTGSGIALILVANSWQERFNNQLGQTARNFTGAMAQHEVNNLDFLSRFIFSAANPSTGAPSVISAITENNRTGLKLAAETPFRSSLLNDDFALDRLIVFNTEGQSLIDWERVAPQSGDYREYIGTDLSQVEQVQNILRGKREVINGQEFDKFSGLINFRSSDNRSQIYFFTVAPVINQQTRQIVGGALVASRLDNLLQHLQTQSQSAITTIYDITGSTVGTTVAGLPLTTLDMSPEQVREVVQLNEEVQQAYLTSTPPDEGAYPTPNAQIDPCIDIGNQRGGLINPLAQSQLPSCSLKTIKTLNEREYEFVYAPLLIRGVQTGFFSISLSRDFVISAWSSSRWAVIGVTAMLAVGAVIVGLAVAQQITHPLDDLVATAEAVRRGDLERRTAVRKDNELGRLAVAFNQMTEHLMRLYTVSRDLSEALEIRQVLAITAEAARSLAPGTEVLALLRDNERWRYYLHDGNAEQVYQLSKYSYEHMPVETLFSSDHAPQVVATAEFALPEIANEAGLHSLMLTPLIVHETPVGILIMGHPSENAFDDSVARVLVAVANMSITVLHNASLYTQVRKDANERQAMLDSIGDGVIVCDTQGRIVLLNRVAERMLELYDWRVKPYNFRDLVFEPVEINAELFGGSETSSYYRINGLTIVSRTDAAVIGNDGQVLGEVIVLHDISTAVAVDAAKTDFIATISHELRTPLTVICGYVDLMLRGIGGKPTPDQAELLEQVRAQAGTMTALVNNAITIANIAAGKMSISPQPVDVLSVVEQVVTPMRKAFTDKGLELNVPDAAVELPPAFADREQLKIVFAQLLDNALRYTHQGSVTIRAQTEGSMLRVDIEDTGEGISPEVMSRLFTRFQRVEGNNQAQRGGGLGLAITRQLIERQGGKVTVTSTYGKGSTFSVLIPQAHEDSLAVNQSTPQTTAS